jgi:acyl carrier protein
MGSTIIAEQDPHRVAQITEVDDLDDFTCLELDSTITLDFVLFLQDQGAGSVLHSRTYH